MNRLTVRDEREVGVDLAADRLAGIVLAFGILVIVAWRAFTLDEASWDLLGLLVLSGVVATGYRVTRRASSTRLISVMAIAAAIGMAVAVVLGLAIQNR
jgi:hypothetical protein